MEIRYILLINNVHCKPIPVMKTGFSLCTFSHREKPVYISWDPCNENRFLPVGKKYTGKSLFWPCTDPVRDCSVVFFLSPKGNSQRKITTALGAFHILR